MKEIKLVITNESKMCIGLSDCNVKNFELINVKTNNIIGKCMTIEDFMCDFLFDVMIYNQFQNNGYGTLMIKELIKSYKKPLSLYVDKSNKKAIHIYKKLGFKTISHDCEDEFKMQYIPDEFNILLKQLGV